MKDNLEISKELRDIKGQLGDIKGQLTSRFDSLDEKINAVMKKLLAPISIKEINEGKKDPFSDNTRSLGFAMVPQHSKKDQKR